MNYTEQALSFDCAGERLLGIVAQPEYPKATGLLIVVGGPQYRVGSHRQFVLLSRALAAAGYFVMRFDHGGSGDSSGAPLDFQALNNNFSAAIDAFQVQCPSVKNVVLWGLCDAASASLLYLDATHDPRVTGLVLLNPWVRSEISLAKTRIKHYYGQRLLQADFWRKLLTGNLGLVQAIQGFTDNLKKTRETSISVVNHEALPFQQRMARGLETFSGQVLFILSGNDYTAKEFLEVAAERSWAAILGQSRIQKTNIPEADHTFSTAEWRHLVEKITQKWLEESHGR